MLKIPQVVRQYKRISFSKRYKLSINISREHRENGDPYKDVLRIWPFLRPPWPLLLSPWPILLTCVRHTAQDDLGSMQDYHNRHSLPKSLRANTKSHTDSHTLLLKQGGPGIWKWTLETMRLGVQVKETAVTAKGPYIWKALCLFTMFASMYTHWDVTRKAGKCMLTCQLLKPSIAHRKGRRSAFLFPVIKKTHTPPLPSERSHCFGSYRTQSFFFKIIFVVK